MILKKERERKREGEHTHPRELKIAATSDSAILLPVNSSITSVQICDT